MFPYVNSVTCKQCDINADWRVNGAGFHHSHKHGFGLLNAWRLVNLAKVHTFIQSTSFREFLEEKVPGEHLMSDYVCCCCQVWESVPFLVSYQSSVIKVETPIPKGKKELIYTWEGNSAARSPCLFIQFTV